MLQGERITGLMQNTPPPTQVNAKMVPHGWLWEVRGASAPRSFHRRRRLRVESPGRVLKSRSEAPTLAATLASLPSLHLH